MRTLWLFPDGRVQVNLVDEIDLPHLQTGVDGYIELVPLPGLEAVMFVNEDGRRRELPDNPLASRIAGQSIVGVAVLVGPTDRDGDSTGLSAEVTNRVLEMAGIRSRVEDSLPAGVKRVTIEKIP